MEITDEELADADRAVSTEELEAVRRELEAEDAMQPCDFE